MRWRVTASYLFSIVISILLVIILNIVAAFIMLVVQSHQKSPILKGLEPSANQFTRSFAEHVIMTDNNVTISEAGKQLLKTSNAWIQVLQEDGVEVYSYRLPSDVQKKYTPVDIIQMYKYREVNIDTNVFIGGKIIDHREFSYLIGIRDRTINKIVMTLDSDYILHLLKVGGILFFSINGVVTLLIGYLFSRRLSKPLNSIIDGIKHLVNEKYDHHYAVKGIYKDVFYNVNRLSTQLKQTEEERKRLDRMKEEWIGNISHDIKTPLASIQGYAEMMGDPSYQFTLQEMSEYANIIQNKSLYIKEVIEDLSLTTRLRNKQITLHKKRVNLVSLLRNVVIDILNDTKYAERHIAFICDEARIDAEVDVVLIRRAISNLIYNAIVHNDMDTQIIVSIAVTDRALITIEDNGIGINSDELDKLFDRYYRGTNTGELQRGSGLGMAIANDAIQAHGGRIEITSEINRGTKVIIYL
ncbi:HAMP domain-containing histidine kinase [Paenibacillus sp. GSMTC-2017]|uniref:HAMP domain-containing sensor histidine kinase n=1 Tax=Paenibacillus sp. GSMTC-2017 TaxID=2794350 RepID=UPI0018D820AA|nr:HAMP domain-containing sensor histidine kinase [Paenibacillus sp. GSMTC-2017]MBH5317069.1 HAMP domain-containing histidine kinase [Paenibacillus sp. GSMTC-2017]